MSEQKTNNLFTGLTALGLLAAAIGWISFVSQGPASTIATNEVEAEEKVVHVHSTEAPEEVAEEIVVVADELVEKAQEAAVRNQVNQAMKKSEDTDIADAE